MTVHLQKRALDLGIVTRNESAMWEFYSGLLGLPSAGEVTIPGVGRIRKLQCGESLIKMLVPVVPPPVEVQRGGYAAATGYRYCTLSVSGLTDLVAGCRKAGHVISVEPRELRPGTWAAMVEDPDGNTVELFETRS